PVRYFLIQPFYVKGASMEPNFVDHEYLVIDELSWRFRSPVRGEIAVFKYPKDPSQYFIKRVVGLSGETVKIENGQIYIYNEEKPEGFLLQEPYLENIRTDRSGTTKVGSDEYFVMGDNRSSSLDSRFFGPVSKSAFVGRVWLRGWPIERWKIFNPPQYSL
ncbi:MAG: signal peptidase I, partial [bacterium]